jgi:alpha-2-macroglobulin
MKTNDATLAQKFIRYANSIIRFFALVLGALIGKWQPPVWMRWITGKSVSLLAKRPKTWVAVALIAAGSWIGIQHWRQWWEMHRPQERQLVAKRELTYTIAAPNPTAYAHDKPAFGTLTVQFSDATAPLESIEKTVTNAVQIQPVIKGSWSWKDDRTLFFAPQEEWRAGQEYSLLWQTGGFPEEVVLPEKSTTFRSEALAVQVVDYKFYTQPDQPDLHQLTATLRANYALTLETLQAQLRIETLAEKPEAFGGTAPTFTLAPGTTPNLWYLRTARLKVPEQSEEVKLTIAKALQSSSGGTGMSGDVVAKAIVPDKYSALKLNSAQLSIVKNEQGEPKQFLHFATTLGVSALELNQVVRLYRLKKEDDDALQDRRGTANDVMADMIARATRIPLERVQRDDESPYPDEHAYQLFSPAPGRLLLVVASGLPALGGFEMAQEYRSFLTVPSYPRELEWTGKGNILALHGERTIQFKSRGVEFIQVTCGRMPAGEINHFITQNDYGDLANPSLEGSFSKDNLVRSQTFVLRVGSKNHWDAHFTSFDLGKAMATLDPNDPEPSRGLYFVEARAVIPRLPGKPDESVYSRVEEKEYPWEYGEPIEDRSFYDVADEAAKRLCLHADGRVVHPSEWFSDVPADGSVRWEQSSPVADRFVMLTDLGMMVKTNADLSRDVFVMSLRGQGPVANVRVTMLARNGSVLAEGVTDLMGRVILPKPTVTAREQQAVAVMARQGQDMSFIPLRPGQLPAMDYSRYDVDGVMSSRTKAVEAHLFTERGVYRPGDSIHFGGIVKRRDWQAVIAGLPVRAILQDSEGNQVQNLDLSVPGDGFIEGTMATQENHPTGVYELSLWVRSDSDHVLFLLGRIALRVEDFRPDRLKMKVGFEPALAKGWIKPADVKAKVTVENLFGIAAADRRVTGNLLLQPAEFRFEAWKDYRFHNQTASASDSIAGKTVDLGEVKTSAQGEAEIALALTNFDKVNMSVALQLEAFESDGGHGVRDQQTILVSPWESVTGYSADCDLDYLGKDAGGVVKLLAIDANLQAVAMSALRYRISETKYVSILRQEKNGNMSYESQQRKVMLSEQRDVAWTAGENQVNLDTSKVGHFTFQVLNENDEIICEFAYRVVGKGDESRSLEREAELNLTVAQQKVEAGGEIEVAIVAPYAGAGLITIEREKVLHAQWFVADTSASVHKLRVPEGIEGTVYCNVSFVRSMDSPDVFMTPLSYATQPVRIEPVQRQLSVELSTPKEVRPGQELVIRYRTDRPSRIILYAVDEGIHQITRYKRPQPLDFFFRKQALEVRTQQWFDLLLPEYRFIKHHAAFGGDGGEDMDPLTMALNPFKRKRDAPVVWWSGIQTAGSESKELRYQVPDYFAGTLTVMAVAVTESRAGSAQTSALVRSPLVLTLNSPTAVTPGDEFVVSVTLANLLEQEGAAEVALRVEPSAHLQVIGDASSAVTVEKGAEGTKRFRFKSLDSLGSATVRCFATAGGESSVRTETLSIRPATPFRTQVRSAFIRTGKNEQAVTRSLYDAYRRKEVTASPLPVVLALGMRDYMNAYAYDCTEQLTSKGMTLLAYRDMSALPQQGDITTDTIATVISQLQSRQGNSGGFGYWRGSTHEGDDFLNCYAAHFLLEAKEAGFAVPQNVISRMNAKLKEICKSGDVSGLPLADRKAYAVYLLTRQGQRPNALLSLRESLDRTQSGQWQTRLCGSFLAATYALQQNQREAQAIRETWKLAKASDYKKGEDYWSNADVDGLLSFAIRARHFSDAVKNYGYADWQQLYGVLWQDRYNTITAACATLGMREFAKVVQGNAFQFEIDAKSADGSAAVSLVKTGEIFATAPFAEAIRSLHFRLDQKDGDQGLFYQVVEEGYDRALPDKPQKDGIEVLREFTTMDGKPIESLSVGESLKMTLRVRNISKIPLGNLVMVDLLPGGFALEPGGLRPGVDSMPGTERVDVREDRNLFFFSLEGAKDLKLEYNLRATSAGEFVVPPLFAESMYDRGVNGVGVGGRIKILARE